MCVPAGLVALRAPGAQGHPRALQAGDPAIGLWDLDCMPHTAAPLGLGLHASQAPLLL